MIDKDHTDSRLIRVYSNETEELVGEIELSSFDLPAFQRKLCLGEVENPMFDCFQIEPDQIAFVEKYIDSPVEWDFQRNYYFIEAEGV